MKDINEEIYDLWLLFNEELTVLVNTLFDYNVISNILENSDKWWLFLESVYNELLSDGSVKGQRDFDSKK